MTVNTIGQSTYANGLQKKQQNMNNMFAALKSGDMASAQKAYASSGMPPMAANNTSPLGRLYQALRNEDLSGAQKAALDMQGKSGKKYCTAYKRTSNRVEKQGHARATNGCRLGASQHQSPAIQCFSNAGTRHQRQHVGLRRSLWCLFTTFKNHEKYVP